MSATTLRLTPRDPIVARDGRPFGEGQGNRMRGLGWPLPSVVAGSFRTALVKSKSGLDFEGDMPRQLLNVEVAGIFPAIGEELYLPAPNDCLWDEKANRVFRVQPVPLDKGEGADLPVDGLHPVRLTNDQAEDDFKAKTLPAWWPLSRMAEWLTKTKIEYPADWFGSFFLDSPIHQSRDHVSLDPHTGAAAEGQIFSTSGLNVAHLPRFGVPESKPFHERFAEIALSARIETDDDKFKHVEQFNLWHPLGGERRLVHWQTSDDDTLWACPDAVRSKLKDATHVRMVLATPAIFAKGWKPDWLKDGVQGTPPGTDTTLKLVGAAAARWQAISGWSLAKLKDQPRGPKPVRRMVPAGSVYFFELQHGSAEALAARWLHSVCDREQDQRDGFGLAVWGTWQPDNMGESKS